LILYFRGNDESFSREHQRYEAMEADGYGSWLSTIAASAARPVKSPRPTF
jgi:hypothetical protein